MRIILQTFQIFLFGSEKIFKKGVDKMRLIVYNDNRNGNEPLCRRHELLTGPTKLYSRSGAASDEVICLVRGVYGRAYFLGLHLSQDLNRLFYN